MPLCLAGIAIGLFGYQMIPFAFVLSSLSFIGWFCLLGARIGSTLREERIPWANGWTLWGIGTTLIVLHSGVYFLFGSTPISIFLTICCITFLGFLFKHNGEETKGDIKEEKQKEQKNQYTNIPLIGLIILCVSLMIFFILQGATTDALPSPWQALPIFFFILYGLTACFVLIGVSIIRSRALSLVLLMGFFFITFNVATIIYPLGFGYDPFLHRASEEYIFAHGAITPKTPFYIGQYALINIFAHITSLPIKSIDIFLVPILAMILLPLAIFYGLRYGAKTTERNARIGTLFALIYPLQTLYATTPYNLSSLFTLVTIFLGLTYHTLPRLRPVVFATALAALATHPIPGSFAVLFVAGLMIFGPRTNKKFFKRNIPACLFIMIGSLLSPLLFLAFKILHHQSLPPLSNILEHGTYFFLFFKEPYYFLQTNVHFVWDIIYTYRKLIPIIVILAAIGGMKRFVLLPVMTVILLVNSFLLSSWITFDDLHIYEQLQYGGRLLHVSLYFVLPISIIGFLSLIEYIEKKSKTLLWLIFPIVSLLITGSLYLLYPQTNPKVYFRGFNVTQADYTAATFIHDTTPAHMPYVVLSTILTAAASIEQYGFLSYYDTSKGNQFYYSIPSGSPLYELFLSMVYKGQKRAFMEEAMTLTGTKRAYFVIPKYWDRFDEIVRGATESADEAIPIQDGNMWVFVYSR